MLFPLLSECVCRVQLLSLLSAILQNAVHENYMHGECKTSPK